MKQKPVRPEKAENKMIKALDAQRAEAKPDVPDPDAPITLARVSGREGLYTDMTARGFRPGLVRKPHVNTMLVDLYVTLYNELHKLRAKAETSDEGLTLSEVKKMHLLTQQLVAIAKEEREQTKEDKLNQLTDEQLIEQAKIALGVMEDGDD